MASLANSNYQNVLDEFSKSSINEIKRLTDLLNKQRTVTEQKRNMSS